MFTMNTIYISIIYMRRYIDAVYIYDCILYRMTNSYNYIIIFYYILKLYHYIRGASACIPIVCTTITKLVKRHFIHPVHVDSIQATYIPAHAVRADHLAIGSIYGKLSMCMTSLLFTSYLHI